MLSSISFLTITALLATERVAALPRPQSIDKRNFYSGGPPQAIYGANPTVSGPRTPGQTTFKNETGIASPVDVLFQNLLNAEWIVEGIYKQGIEYFKPEDFVAAGFPNTTYDRLVEIYQNENGHLAIFEAAITSGVTKPSQCKYDYGFKDITPRSKAAKTYIDIVSLVELGSMAYLTGLAQSASSGQSIPGLSTVVGVLSVETRHLSWINTVPLGGDPFAGPSDTVYPWATQVLSITKQFIIPNSCPAGSPVYPIGDQLLPKLDYLDASDITPGGHLDLIFEPTQNSTTAYYPNHPPPHLVPGTKVTANFFHELWNYTVPITIPANATDTASLVLRVPLPPLPSFSGLLIVALSNITGPLQSDRPEDVIAGPLFIQLAY